MPEPQLSDRSAKARDLAHELARREGRSVAEIVERALEAYQRREAPHEPPEVFYKRLSETWGRGHRPRRAHSGSSSTPSGAGLVIFLDRNVVSETLKRTPNPAVTSWLARFEVELVLSTVAIAEVAYGIEKIRPDQRSRRLERGLAELRRHFADRRIFPFTEQAALIYGALMGETTRAGRPMSVPDAMIAAIAKTYRARLATRNLADFEGSGLQLISPWAR